MMLKWQSITLSSLFLLFIYSCIDSGDSVGELPREVDQPKLEILGETQGTTYQIITGDDSLRVTKFQIDSLFTAFDSELNTYIPTSIISQFNNNEISTIDFSEHNKFATCFIHSYNVFKTSNGYFDPSVYPLMKQWDFMKDVSKTVSQESIDSVLAFTGFEQGRHFNKDKVVLSKLTPSFKLDFNAIAQGYSVDVVKEFLDSKGQQNYYIEIGGELFCKGKNKEGNTWLIGVDNPTEENDGVTNRELENAIYIDNKAMATSGNYRKFYEIEGKKYAHTLNPKTGYPVTHQLLSATVVMDNCALADAYATTFMVIGLEETKLFLENHPELNIEVYLLYENEMNRIERFVSEGLKDGLMN